MFSFPGERLLEIDALKVEVSTSMKMREIHSQCGFIISRVRGHILMFALAALLITKVGCDQTIAREKSEREDKDNFLELKLDMITPVLCLGSSIPLSLSITNTGKEEIKVLRSRLWNKFSYSYFGTEENSLIKGGSTTYCGGFDPDNLEIPLVISPGMTYQETHEFLPPEEFFRGGGNYKIRVRYQSSSSNDAKFRFDDCK